MRVFLIFFFSIISILGGYALDIGAALSVDYYNSPIDDSAGSQIQQRPVIFNNLDIGLFNLRSGIGITEGYYDISEEDGITPVFNDMYDGFYTIEFDIYLYPGIKIDITDNVTLGLSAGGGVRLPVLTGLDDGLDSDVVDESFDWFYSDFRFIFWGGGLYVSVKLPKSESTRFFGSVNYKSFINRTDQWIVGTTIGLLWHLE